MSSNWSCRGFRSPVRIAGAPCSVMRYALDHPDRVQTMLEPAEHHTAEELLDAHEVGAGALRLREREAGERDGGRSPPAWVKRQSPIEAFLARQVAQGSTMTLQWFERALSASKASGRASSDTVWVISALGSTAPASIASIAIWYSRRS